MGVRVTMHLAQNWSHKTQTFAPINTVAASSSSTATRAANRSINWKKGCAMPVIKHKMKTILIYWHPMPQILSNAPVCVSRKVHWFVVLYKHKWKKKTYGYGTLSWMPWQKGKRQNYNNTLQLTCISHSFNVCHLAKYKIGLVKQMTLCKQLTVTICFERLIFRAKKCYPSCYAQVSPEP